MTLSKKEKDRYHRQIILKGFGLEAQLKLKAATVLVVGAGGLGCPCLTYLAAAGVGKIGIADADKVSLSNLHRQVLYGTADIDKSKCEIAKEKLISKNENVEIITHSVYINEENCLEILKNYDLVIDASDNFNTRYLLNDACVILKKPLVFGALFEFEGQVSTFNYHDGPTLRCLFPEKPKEGVINNCAEAGVLGVLPGIIGNWQALEAIKVITQIGDVLSGKLLMIHALSNEVKTISFKTNPKNKEKDSLNHFFKIEDAKNQEVDNYLLKHWMDEDDIQIIDVREDFEFENTNIGGLNLPLSILEKTLSKIDGKQKTVVVCQSGVRSKKGLKIILNHYPSIEIYHLKGGLSTYLL
ncbi:HesA/MoeB/ThiF family protein [Pedobacter cryophilus]|uniref:Molybdopterin-synthase adenylyltransferase n=1 Tax=Pedobacter cryophilus TaxID=2571271 RepID=A0A4U1C0J4_9SPHI|nr:HesA/MoeB/ThiF family protein [Pedobacter cryophilus]TKB97590.1 molybdopterin-synthase adenylyltransferase MoeB [Pedobacter cryophilus]